MVWGLSGHGGKANHRHFDANNPFDRAHQDSHFLEAGRYAALSKLRGRISTGAFGLVAVLFQAVLIALLWPTDYDFESNSVFTETIGYSFLAAVTTLALVGMGFLFTFIRSYGLSAIGFSFFQVALGIQWALLCRGWMKQQTLELQFSIEDFVQATVAVFGSLIAFGVLAGKVSPLQTLLLTLCEIAAYMANKVLFLESPMMGVQDTGCTISLCVFATYFGLAASIVYGPAHEVVAQHGARPSYYSELFGFLGTLFLWLNWPTFISAHLPMGSAPQRLAMLNCVFALLGSTVIAFGATTIPTQRLYTCLALASLSGGVSVGAVANFRIRPGGASLIGVVAGVLSCWLFKAPFGNTVAYDTFNMHAVFGAPGVLGGLVSVIAPAIVPGCTLNFGHQLGGLLGTCLFSGIAGAGTGWLLKLAWPPAVAYTDETYWEPAEDIPKEKDPNSIFGF